VEARKEKEIGRKERMEGEERRKSRIGRRKGEEEKEGKNKRKTGTDGEGRRMNEKKRGWRAIGTRSQNVPRASPPSPSGQRAAAHKATFDELATRAILGTRWGKTANPAPLRESLSAKYVREDWALGPGFRE
jgi:hypothetical protein